ncbi:MAG: HAMP domain-containing histidine kinase, partial [Candidatus Omnitrophica bacterium]|nr:HAMP domain-containing histidine kinase [Candidatus Omnitrophota bacterium]
MFKRVVSILILGAFLANSVMPAYAQGVSIGAGAAVLPEPGTMVALSQSVDPPMLKGIRVYANDPFRFDFILDKGGARRSDPMPRPYDEAQRFIKYFLASLTIPEKDLWVNLSPYEKSRIIPNEFGQTEMGRDLLAQDYILKQVTASLLYPEGETGKKFWAEVYKQAAEKYGTTDIPVDTFNKVWIIPDKAVVYEKSSVAYIVESRLKVMLESDYLATSKNATPIGGHVALLTDISKQGYVSPSPLPAPQPLNTKATQVSTLADSTRELTKNILRSIVIPILEKEINEGANFATLRQVTNALILATWYKRKIQGAIHGSPLRDYVDQNKIRGVNSDDPNVSEKIWSQYVAAFKKGVVDVIREERDTFSGEVIPRKYFSGGVGYVGMELDVRHDDAMIPAGGDIFLIRSKAAVVPANPAMVAVAADAFDRHVMVGLYSHEIRNQVAILLGQMAALHVAYPELTRSAEKTEQQVFYVFKRLSMARAQRSVNSWHGFLEYIKKVRMLLVMLHVDLLKIQDPRVVSMPEYQRAIEHIRDIDQFIFDLLDSARTNKNIFSSLEHRPVVLNAALSGIIDKYPSQQRARIVYAPHATLAPVWLDARKLELVIVNLIKNAFEAMDAHGTPGTLTIRTESDAAAVRIIVTDEGGGFSPEAKEKLFKLNGSYGKAGGSGFGLYLCKDIVERHGGTITAENAGEDTAWSGARFTITFPVEALWRVAIEPKLHEVEEGFHKPDEHFWNGFSGAAYTPFIHAADAVLQGGSSAIILFREILKEPGAAFNRIEWDAFRDNLLLYKKQMDGLLVQAENLDGWAGRVLSENKRDLLTPLAQFIQDPAAPKEWQNAAFLKRWNELRDKELKAWRTAVVIFNEFRPKGVNAIDPEDAVMASDKDFENAMSMGWQELGDGQYEIIYGGHKYLMTTNEDGDKKE